MTSLFETTFPLNRPVAAHHGVLRFEPGFEIREATIGVFSVKVSGTAPAALFVWAPAPLDGAGWRGLLEAFGSTHTVYLIEEPVQRMSAEEGAAGALAVIRRFGFLQVDWLGAGRGGYVGMSLAAHAERPVSRLAVGLFEPVAGFRAAACDLPALIVTAPEDTAANPGSMMKNLLAIGSAWFGGAAGDTHAPPREDPPTIDMDGATTLRTA
jgi:hypothetical protein